MNTLVLQDGTVHTLPPSLRDVLLQSEVAQTAWRDITPLARNEWICWVESAKRPETKIRRTNLTIAKLESGMRRPCCWEGCSHRERKPNKN